MKTPTIPVGRNWPAQIGNRGAVAMAHGRWRRRPIPVTGGETGWGKWLRCTPAARGSDFGWWREGKATVEHAPWWRAGGRLEGNDVEGIFRWWWRLARGSEGSPEHRRCSRRRRRGGLAAGGAGRQWCTRGHGGSFGYSPQRHYFVEASEPARAWGRGGARCAAGRGARGAMARLINSGSKE
jgi:hypothetical protein